MITSKGSFFSLISLSTTSNFPFAVCSTNSFTGNSFDRFSSKSEIRTIGLMPICLQRLSLFGLWLANTIMGSVGPAFATSGGTVSALDMAFRRVLLFSQLFTDSWGDPKILQDLLTHRHNVMSQRKVIDILEVQSKNEMIIEKESVKDNVRTLEGKFRSPHAVEFPHHMNGPVQWAHWKGLFPKKEKKGLVIHLAGTGDHTYFRREEFLVKDLLKETGSAGIMLHNPFYAQRKPAEQFRSSLKNVSDLFVMGAALISECLYILRWAMKEGYWPLGISGISMGGHMTSLAASNAIFPVAVVPVMSWTSAAPVYTEGALSAAISFPKLEKQLVDPLYRGKLAEIENNQWLEQARQLNEENKKGLAFNFMWVIMSEFTDLRYYPVPIDTSLVHSIIAEADAYVLRRGATPLQDIWPHANISHLPEVGHVAGYFTGHAQFRAAIAGRLQATLDKYPQPTIIVPNK